LDGIDKFNILKVHVVSIIIITVEISTRFKERT
jgi:hypothetical protein